MVCILFVILCSWLGLGFIMWKVMGNGDGGLNINWVICMCVFGVRLLVIVCCSLSLSVLCVVWLLVMIMILVKEGLGSFGDMVR